MKKINTKQIVPIMMAIIGVVFAVIGFTQLGFWDANDGPKPGFFPSIMAIVMVLTSVLAFVQSRKEEEKPDYKPTELLVIAGGIGIFVSTFIIGLIPACMIFVVLWLKLFEKESWKNVIIVLLVVAAIAIGVFGMWLGIQFPMGLFESLM
ncbi:MAG: tripartite tricarboxylate transporter TctB family protein [Suipraeoptans sp.]